MRRTIEERFWSKVLIGAPGDCWPWTRGLTSTGYGQFKLKVGTSPWKASRVAWLLSTGEDPGDRLACHHCDNPPCCNPAHLFLGTVADNTADMMAKGRGASASRGSPSAVALVERNRCLSNGDIAEALRRSSSGESSRSIARDFRCSHTTISRLVNGTHWLDLGRGLPLDGATF